MSAFAISSYSSRTSHSTTTQRKNALITIGLHGRKGFGECGLPPKKQGVYYADYDDCLAFFQTYCEKVRCASGGDDPQQLSAHNPFPPSLVGSHFAVAATQLTGDYEVYRSLFALLDREAASLPCEHRSCFGAIESALLDLWAQSASLPLYKFIGLCESETPRLMTFCTVSLNTDMSVIRKETKRGLAWTPNLKIKVNDDLPLIRAMLDVILEECKASGKHCSHLLLISQLLSLDANAAWSPQVARDILETIVPLKEMIYMVEQPYPVDVSECMNEWKEIKQLYGEKGLAIYGDESVCTYEDVKRLGEISHGVNVKLDKTGGIRNAIRLISEANALNLSLWFGMMVGSQLACTTVSHVLPLAKVGDLDGSFLITSETNPWTGGCVISPDGRVILSSESGLGLTHRG